MALQRTSSQLFTRIKPLLCRLDFKNENVDERFYYGRVSAYNTTMALKTPESNVVQTELRVVTPLSHGAYEEVSYFHRIIRNNGLITIVDPRAIFAQQYDENVFTKVPAVFSGTLDEFKTLGTELIESGKIPDFWAKEYLKEYIDLIIEQATSPARIMEGEHISARYLRKQTGESV